MTTVEAAQAAAQNGRRILRLDDADQDDGDEKSDVQVHRAMNPRGKEGSGITFQRCGGGRRVIRRQRGGN